MFQGNNRCLTTPVKMTPVTPRKCNKDPVEVYCRLRPLRNTNDPICVRKYNETTIKLTPIGIGKLGSFFTFRSVFPESTTQTELFEKVGFPLLKSLIHGKNGKFLNSFLFYLLVISSILTFTYLFFISKVFSLLMVLPHLVKHIL